MHRLTIEISEKEYKALEEVAEKNGLRTKVSAIRFLVAKYLREDKDE